MTERGTMNSVSSHAIQSAIIGEPHLNLFNDTTAFKITLQYAQTLDITLIRHVLIMQSSSVFVPWTFSSLHYFDLGSLVVLHCGLRHIKNKVECYVWSSIVGQAVYAFVGKLV